MKISNLELACQIFWGTTVDYSECGLKESDNPEESYTLKEALETLSDDAKLMVSTIINLPDEMFYSSGVIIQRELVSWMKRRYGWKTSKTTAIRVEIASALGVAL